MVNKKIRYKKFSIAFFCMFWTLIVSARENVGDHEIVGPTKGLSDYIDNQYAQSHEFVRVFRIKNYPLFDQAKTKTAATKISGFSNNSESKRIKRIQVSMSKAIDEGYLCFILTKLNELQLPPQLALIPIIESGYNKDAVSAKGAGGLWQLMPRTASQLGIDTRERFELSASTVAALHLLQQLHHEFGRWDLALAAYNAGSGRVQKALSEKPFDSITDLSLPKETKDYVSQFIILQNLLENGYS